MSEPVIEVGRRQELGKNANRRLRAQGAVPAVVYGGGRDPLSIQVNAKRVQDLLRTGGENAVFLLQLEGTKQSRHVMIRDRQTDPRNGQLIHLDFVRIAMDETVRVKVPIELVGVAEGVKNEGGLVDFVTRELEVECLPSNIPTQVELDISALHIGQHLEAKAIQLGAGVSLVDEPGRVILSVVAGRVSEAAEGEEEEGLLESAAAEPEVITRGKGEEEED